MDKIKNIFALLALWLAFAAIAFATGSPAQGESIDVKKIIFEHVKDSYEWHIITVGETHVTLPLPVIVYSKRSGWHIFSSSHFHHAPQYNGLYVSHTGDNEGKVVELNEAGEEERPLLDISLTKNALSLIINSLLLIAIVLGSARWYRGKSEADAAPRGFVGTIEMLVASIDQDVIKACVGEEYRRYSPYLLTAFFFIFFNNMMGILPLFPGGANLTGNIAVTCVLALCTFVAVNLFGNREYWREILWPEVPVWLKVPVPLMPAIELIGVVVKPFALMIRLFANIFAGHAAILAFICIIFITAAISSVICVGMSVVSLALAIFMNAMEFLVAFVQAYVFTMLSSVFIGMSRPRHHHSPQEK